MKITQLLVPLAMTALCAGIYSPNANAQVCTDVNISSAADDGVKITLLDADSEWEWATENGGNPVFPYASAIYTGKCNPGWANEPATAGWISKVAGCGGFGDTERVRFRRTFNLGTVAGTVIDLDLFADNFVREVRINDVAYFGTDTFPVSSFGNSGPVRVVIDADNDQVTATQQGNDTITPGANLVVGENTIEIVVGQQGGPPGGLMVDAEVFQDCTPVLPVCGDGNLDADEGCDDNNTMDGDGCDSDCKVEDGGACGTTGLTGAPACTSGRCNANTNICGIACGDGTLDAAEGCDDNNAVDGDGCSQACLIEDDSACNNNAAGLVDGASCVSGFCDANDNICKVAPGCGNGNVEANEGCDDNNTMDGDGCNSNCLVEDGGTCGSTGLTGDLACAVPSCNPDTNLCEAYCGNGTVDAGEECDDGNATDDDECSNACVTNTGLTCDAPINISTGGSDGVLVELGAADPSWTIASILGGEGDIAVRSGQCVGQWNPDLDDASWISKNANCQPFAPDERNFFQRSFSVTNPADTMIMLSIYADNYVREVYINGAPLGIDSFPTNLFRTPETTILQGVFTRGTNTLEIEVEQTGGQPGGMMLQATAYENCVAEECGNSLVEATEGCDDGNRVDGDGCAADCLVENENACGTEGLTDDASCVSGNCADSGNCEAICGDGIKDATEGCDDGNTDGGDNCSADCLVEDGGACGSAPGLTGDDACVNGCNETNNRCGPGCGDGVLDANEGCDDGNGIGVDGCNFRCLVEIGLTCGGAPGLEGDAACATGACDADTNVCVREPCGNGSLDADEQCDDGNRNDFDGCDSECRTEGEYICEDVLLNTSFDGTATLAAGLADPNWTYSPLLGGAQVAAETTDRCSGIWQDPTLLQATGWVTKPGGCTTFALREQAYFSRKVEINNAAGASLTFDIYTDNHVREIYVNGVAQGFDAGSQNLFRAPAFTVTLDSGFVSGTNTITILTQQSGGQPGGLLIDSLAYTTCRIATCGDGNLDALEACDDGNNDSGDGCTATCLVEAGGVCNDNADCLAQTCTAGLCAFRCGDGVVDATEGCDDGNILAGDGCDAACLVEDGGQCGLGALIGSAACASAVCNDASNICGAGCGDGNNDDDEACDDGNLISGDGCSNECLLEAGEPCAENDQCSTALCLDSGECAADNCGDSTLDANEGCDDGNRDDGDGCSSLCRVEVGTACNEDVAGFVGDASCISGTCNEGICAFAFCGNGILEFNEGCDDGRRRDGDGCTADCKVELSRQCGRAPGLVGDAACASENCGDDNTCVIGANCGDGNLDATEGCDDGNNTDGDGCSAACLVENDSACTDDAQCVSGLCNTFDAVCADAFCGDGVVAADEACDDANRDAGDGCNAACLAENGEACGSAGVTGDNACESGNCGDDNVCAAPPGCGDGNVDATEGCDDGNNQNGDGCSNNCLVEDGEPCGSTGLTGDEACVSDVCGEDGNCGAPAGCGDGNVDADEGCDDNNTENGDGCSAGCLAEDGQICGTIGLTGDDACVNDCDAESNTCGDVEIADRDGDGIEDAEDNCPDTANTDQADEDDNGIGDVCEDGTTVTGGGLCTCSSSQSGPSSTPLFGFFALLGLAVLARRRD